MRPLLLLLFLCILICFTITLHIIAPPADTSTRAFVTLWLVSFLPYLAICILILATKPPSGRWRWGELGIILVGLVILYAILLPLEPDLSRDSWRYLWDARVTLHGYSPYVYAPLDPALTHLRNFLLDNSRFRTVPTLYPPAAQAVYLLSYLIAPDNLFVFKGILLVLNLFTTLALALFLHKRGLDSSRCIIYAWCPLPIVEFALQGHHEAITILYTMLALLCSLGAWRGSRVVTGFLLALATLTNIYPLLFLPLLLRSSFPGTRAVFRVRALVAHFPRGRALFLRSNLFVLHLLRACRRDWVLLITCFTTIVLAYVPYIILGHGHIFGFFGTYVSEESPNAGPLLVWTRAIGQRVGLSTNGTLLFGYVVDLLVLGSVLLLVTSQCWRKRLSVEAGVLILIGTIFACSTHIFPWYTTALLPWIAPLVGPLWRRQSGWQSKGIAVVVAWYFPCLVGIHYFFDSLRDWSGYYWLTYNIVAIGLCVAITFALIRRRIFKRFAPVFAR